MGGLSHLLAQVVQAENCACAWQLHVHINQASPEKQNHVWADTLKEIYYEGRAPWMMVTEESHDLPTAGWRPKETGPMVLAHTPENQGSSWCKSQSESQCLRVSSMIQEGRRRVDVPAQAESKVALHPPFWSIQALNRWQEACLYW